MTALHASPLKTPVSASDRAILLSFVIPVYRGEPFLTGLVDRLAALRDQLETGARPARVLEAIFVCDEPVDGSAKLLTALAAKHPWVSVVHLARNAGQHGATAAGMLHTSGDWVISIDEDGQHDPFHVLALLDAALPTSRDICYALPTAAVHERWWRNASSRVAKRLVAWLVGDPVVPLFNSFRLVRGEIARAAGALAGHEFYLDVAMRWLTNRVTTSRLELHDPRNQSGYTLRSLLSHFRRLVMAYHPPILRWMPALGFVGAALCVGLGVVAVAQRALYPESVPVQGWTSLFVMVAFSTALMVSLFGLVLERLTSTMSRAQGRPAFMIVDRSKDALWSTTTDPATR
jgi:glycosyltransferase involved in cell wall biosynthesis